MENPVREKVVDWQKRTDKAKEYLKQLADVKLIRVFLKNYLNKKYHSS
jgi:hypothetical protein